MTTSNARAASSCDGVTGESVADWTMSDCVGMLTVGRGGGCIDAVTCVGETCIASSIVAIVGGSSLIGESSAVEFRYFGVSASDEAGGDIYCSTPMSMGNV